MSSILTGCPIQNQALCNPTNKIWQFLKSTNQQYLYEKQNLYYDFKKSPPAQNSCQSILGISTSYWKMLTLKWNCCYSKSKTEMFCFRHSPSPWTYSWNLHLQAIPKMLIFLRKYLLLKIQKWHSGFRKYPPVPNPWQSALEIFSRWFKTC